VNTRYLVIFRDCHRCVLKFRELIVWVAYPEQQHGLRNPLQLGDIADVDICLSRTHIDWQFEDSPVEVIATVK